MKKNNTTMILILYLLGLFMGALDTGIVSPARAVIQGQLGVNETIGIWMITIFTLAYAVSIPISGKLADKFGRKRMYIISILLFGLGSFICSMSSFYDSFTILLIGRVIQAFGGGGIMPIVTAEIGTSFPLEKRGLALGLVGGVYGIANILGSSAGSAILGIAGNQGWHWLFLINVPISIFIILGSIFTLENNRSSVVKRMDLVGTIVMSGMILSLMYGLTNIKFNNFYESFLSTSVYPFLIIFLILLPIFILVERKAQDPILNLKYFTDRNILITFIGGLTVGLALMGMVFVPQFAENALRIKTGAGGYFVTALGLFAGIGAPFSGKLVDKFGAKIVLIAGFSFTLIGSLILAFLATSLMTIPIVLAGLFFMGLGMGFTMGTPLNYMILNAVPTEESGSGLATLSLVRSIGTVLSPAIMIGFLATAGIQVQDNIMNVLPSPSSKLQITAVEQLKPYLEKIKANKELTKKIDPDMLDIDKMMNKNSTTNTLPNANKNSNLIPSDVLNELMSADVTNITDRIKHFASVMFDKNVTPSVILKATDGVQKGIDGIDIGIAEMKKASISLTKKSNDLKAKKVKILVTINDMEKAKSGIGAGITGLKKAIIGIDAGIKGQTTALDKMKIALANIEKYSTTPSVNPPAVISGTDNSQMPPSGPPAGIPSGPMSKDALIKSINDLELSISKMTEQKNQATLQMSNLSKKIIDLNKAQTGLAKAEKGLTVAVSGINTGINSIKENLILLKETSVKMKAVKAEIPQAFKDSKTNYINKLEQMRPEIDSIFQSGLNKGFRNMYIAVSIISVFGIGILFMYKNPKKAKAI